MRWIVVECCAGVRRIPVRLVALDVIEVPTLACTRCGCTPQVKESPVALQVCADCTTRYAAGLTSCPHCGGTDVHEEGSMPKNTVHGGPSIAGGDGDPGLRVTGDPAPAEATADETPADEAAVESAETTFAKPARKAVGRRAAAGSDG